MKRKGMKGTEIHGDIRHKTRIIRFDYEWRRQSMI